ncbi:MAG: DUF5681 domain-containing protein [Proteobacteria bacterium]|nr:DUF5681 domain-containing protein [Pseudomonadota bacterium]
MPKTPPQPINLPENLDDAPYDIGYGKPPKHSQFKPGQSGNPRGRPSGSKSMSTILRKALSERIEVNKGGKRIKRTKLDIAVEQLVNKAAGGDLKAIVQLAHYIERMEDAEAAKQAKSVPLQATESEANVMASIANRIRNTIPMNDSEDTS